MAKLTFKDVVGKEFTLYEVAKSGSISKHTVIGNAFFKSLSSEKNLDMNSSTLHLNKNGNIEIGWGYACFLNADEAAEMATKIITTKYNNSITQIKKITNT